MFQYKDQRELNILKLATSFAMNSISVLAITCSSHRLGFSGLNKSINLGQNVP